MTRHVFTLDLDGITDKADLMERCARALNLPEYFGRNWDALADCLADPDLWPPAAGEQAPLVVVRNWETYAKARPGEWETARAVFTEASAVTVAFGESS